MRSLCRHHVTMPELLRGESVSHNLRRPGFSHLWDTRHPTTAFHLIFAEAIRQCSKDQPNGERPFVKIICPDV
ncbi:unnamed protein product [Ascophyllum nodosum]